MIRSTIRRLIRRGLSAAIRRLEGEPEETPEGYETFREENGGPGVAGEAWFLRELTHGREPWWRYAARLRQAGLTDANVEILSARGWTLEPGVSGFDAGWFVTMKDGGPTLGVGLDPNAAVESAVAAAEIHEQIRAQAKED